MKHAFFHQKNWICYLTSERLLKLQFSQPNIARKKVLDLFVEHKKQETIGDVFCSKFENERCVFLQIKKF